MSIQLGGFALQRRLGKGGMGEVWLATHLEAGVDVALKLMTGDRATEERYREAFRREVRAVARLDHPAIVRVLDCGEVSPEAADESDGFLTSHSPYLVMELAQGTLRDLAGQISRWTQQRTILLRILDALAHAHARGVIHRDLKPENVLLVPGLDGPRLKLADFGLAHAYRQPDDDRENAESITGTPRFMSPEQILGQWRDQGPWTDLYAVGCLAYWLASGKPPYSATTTKEILRAHLHSDLPPLEATEDVPPAAYSWIGRLMAKSRQDRFQLAADAAYALPQSGSDTGDTLRGLPPIPSTWQSADGPELAGADTDELRGVGLGLYGLRQLPLVDRTDERDALWEGLHYVADSGACLAIALSGIMGVGKTRLAEWLAERALEVGAARTIHVRHSPIEAHTHGLAGLVANHLRAHGLSAEAIVARVRDILSANGPLDADDLHDCMAIAELVAPICDADYDPERARVRFSSPRERYALVARFLARSGDDRPLLLILDDVQWGHDTLQFIHFLLTDATEAPATLVMMTIRDDALATRPLEMQALKRLQQTDGFEALDIAPLAEEDHRSLVQNLLGLDSRLSEDVVARTRGNPLFAIQLVGDWVQRGVLIPTGTGFRLQLGASARLPDDIHHLLQERLADIARRLARDNDTDSVWKCLELAAALGHEVEYRQWRAVCHKAGVSIPDKLIDALTLTRLATAEDFRFSFLHGAIRESLEEHAQEAGRWTTHHEVCALALGELYPPGTPGLASRIGRHFTDGRRWDLAIGPLLTAADEARVASEFARAYDLFDSHLEAVDRSLSPQAPTLRALGAIRRARTLLKHNNLTRAASLIDGIDTSNLPAALNAELLFARGVLARSRGEIKEGLELARSCFDAYAALVKESPNDRELLTFYSKAITIYADLLNSAGRLDEALRASKEGLRICQRTGALNEVAASQMQLGNILNNRGEFDTALQWLKKGRDTFDEVGNLYGVAQSENSLGEAYRLHGRPAEALRSYQTAFNLLRRIGVQTLGAVRFNIGMCHVEQGDFPGAHRYFEHVHQALTSQESTGYQGLTHVALMTCAGARGDWTIWQTHLQEARSSLQESGLVLPDIAILATAAMKIATQARRTRSAADAAAIAADQWRRLQQPDKARAVEESLFRESPT